MSLLQSRPASAWSRAKCVAGTVLHKFAASRRLAVTSISAFALFGLGAGLSFLAQFGASRFLGAEAFGEYAYVAAWATLLASLSTLGFHVALLRLLPAYSSAEQWRLARGAFNFSHRATLAVSIVVALAGSALVYAFQPAGRSSLIGTFWIGFAAIPFLSLQLVSSAATRAFGGVVLALAPERIVRDGAILLLLCAAGWSGLVAMNATTAAFAMLLSAVVTCLFARYAALRLRPASIAASNPAYEPSPWMSLALPLTALTLADNLMARSGVIALGLAGRTREAGIFAVAVSFAQLSALPRMAVATMFAPTVSGLHARGDRAAVQSLTTRAAWLSLAGSLCVAGPLLLVLPFIMPWFGAGFESGTAAASILILSQIFCAACGPQQHLLTMTGYERAGALLLMSAAICAFVACFFLIEVYGLVGAAAAMAGAQVGWNLAMAQFIRARLHVTTGALPAVWINPPHGAARRGCDA